MDGKNPKIPLTFRIYKGDQLVRTETLSQQVIKIGKLSSSHLRIDDDLVSRMHAVIEVTDAGEISIIDLGSTKGTVVNGQKVNKATLQDGDVILLGDTRITLSVGEAEAADEEPTSVSAAPAPRLGASTGADQVIASTPRPPAVAPVPQAPPGAPTMRPQPMPQMPLSAPPGMPVAAPPRPMGYQSGPQVSAPAAAPQFGMDAGEDAIGPRTIEVAAMLQDTVVSVRHITNPRGGKVSGLTWALFGIAALMLIVSSVAFAHGVDIAEDNDRDFRHWVEEEKLPAIEFRAKRLAPIWDIMAFGGLIFGLGSAVWGLARVLDERRSPYFRLGRGENVEFPTDDVPPGVEAFPLVAPQGDDFVFSWAPGMTGEMIVEGRSTPLEQIPRTGPIPYKARIRVQSGNSTFLVSSVPAPRHRVLALFAAFDTMILAFLGISAVVHGGLLLLMFLIPDPTKGYSEDPFDDEQRLVKVQSKPQEDPKQLEQMQQNQKDDGQQSGGTGTKQAGEEGKMGKKDSTRQSGQYAMKNMGVDPQLAKIQAMDRARTSGVLGVLRSQQGGSFAALTGTGDFSSGLDDRDVYGGLIGNEVGEMQGGWGYGISGTGAGGGGTGLGTIGTGRYGTIGHGSGTGTGYGVGSGKGGMRGRSASLPKVNIGTATAVGDLDKNTIRRYVRQKLPQIEYCYQKQLVVKPSLAGTVNTQFTIDGNGKVIQVKATGLGDSDVESCVEATIRSIQFPKPTGGGMVNVTSYPFTFRPAGG